MVTKNTILLRRILRNYGRLQTIIHASAAADLPSLTQLIDIVDVGFCNLKQIVLILHLVLLFTLSHLGSEPIQITTSMEIQIQYHEIITNPGL